METYGSIKKKLLKRLEEIGIDRFEARREVEMIVEHVTGFSKTQQLLSSDQSIKDDFCGLLYSFVEKRLQRIPLQYLLGESWFMGLRFQVGPGVLIPRQDTETLVETAFALLKLVDKPVFADVGSGSGAIAISLLHLLPHARVIAIDRSAEAIAFTIRNAELNGVSSRLTTFHGDWLDFEPAEKLDAVISNPPYIPLSAAAELQPEVAVFEPREALFGSDADGLGFYRSLNSRVGRYIKETGFLAVEVGHDQAEQVRLIFKSGPWKNIQTYRDLNGICRVVSAFRDEKAIEN